MSAVVLHVVPVGHAPDTPPPTLCSEARALIRREIPGPKESLKIGGSADRPWEGIALDPADARYLHNVLLANWLAGQWPPQRPKAVRTLKTMEFSNTACTHAGCKIRGCTGNTLYYIDEGRERIGVRWAPPCTMRHHLP